MRTGSMPSVKETYEAWQPPLYYVIGAVVLKALGLEPPYQPLPLNPEFPQEKNYFEPFPGDRFPYSGKVLSLHVLRGISTLFGLGVIVFVFLTARLLFPNRPLLSVTIAAVAALIPQFNFISAIVNNDAAAAFSSAGVIYFGLRLHKCKSWPSLLGAATFGMVCALTKVTALIALVVPAVMIMVSDERWTGKAVRTLLVLLPATMVAGFFAFRNTLTGGDPFVGEALREGGSYAMPLTNPAWRELFFDWVRHSYWYMGGGWLNVTLPSVVYGFLDLFTGVALGGILVQLRSGTLTRFQRNSVLTFAVLILLILANQIYYSVTTVFTPFGRYLFIAQGPLTILLVSGLSYVLWPSQNRDSPLLLLFPLCLLGLNAGILWITLPAAYG